MSAEHSVIDGSYADFKLIKSRSVCQLVVEIPIERAEEAVRVFGMPCPGAEIHVVVARMERLGKQAALTDRSLAGKEAYAGKSDGEQAVVRAALLAKEPRFQKFAGAETEDDAVDFIRERCGVQSRREIANGGAALDWFLTMETEYRHWAGLERTP